MSQENDQPIISLGRKLSELKNHGEDDPNELLKYRFLCREGILGLYGQTGIGKSSFLMQCLILWALGREAFGITPRQPLKSLLIQAENDEGDIAEMRDGVCEGLGLTPDEIKQACDKIIVIHEDSKYGSDFINSVVKPELEVHKPELLCIDCALSYLGGDIISQEVVSKFLRNELKPLLKSHKCAGVIVHHTNKTGNSETVYAGSGSAEWANMPRAILVLSPAGKAFKLTAAKRGFRLYWTMPDGETATLEKRIKHSNVKGRIYWEETGVDDNSDSEQTTEQDQTDEILKRVPQEGTIEKNVLIQKVNEETRIGINKAKELIAQMLNNKSLFQSEHKRSYARPEIHYSRTLDKKAEKIKELLEHIQARFSA